ncbi:MAG: dihydropteroate synthase [Acidimicrobiia bacterium]|nr:dihydropteroate synthase [Acidimicrobiia bacterium]
MTRAVPDWQIKDGALHTPLVMGIVNVTPDSFSDGGLWRGESAVEHGLELLEAGADILDVGGESTRPGAAPVDEAEERDRVMSVVRGLASAGAVVSIDTMKPGVAAAAIDAGARIVNDVGGLSDPAMRRVVAESGAGVVIMHMQGEPRTMQDEPVYDDVVKDIGAMLRERVDAALASGIDAAAIVLDPGIGFGKTLEHNLELIRRMPELAELGHHLLVGASRKRFLGTVLGLDDPVERDRATSILSALLFERGVGIVRVHDVAGTREALSLVRAIVSA